jgi:putative molybdenum carrier protein
MVNGECKRCFMPKRISKIVSGGQTGVDRAALDVALELSIPCGGWCPKGRLAEDGAIPERYPLEETPLPIYPQRTEWNVRDSDGTLALITGRIGGGTSLTIAMARRHKKPYFVVNLSDHPDMRTIRKWVQKNQLHVLNIAGPRESENRGIYSEAAEFLRQLLKSQGPERKSQSPERKRRGAIS